ncbi:MAG TPA: oligosaccharide flippase family protein [Kofleriaceae bacterium]|nr:oligosaccharide flippase family protein [Kofleriaceae bacterium]
MSAQQRMNTNVNRGLAWLGVASSLVGLLDIVSILIILNNWISAEEYGIATKCIWIFPVLDQATDLGLSAAVVQRDDHTPRRISTVFWINVMLSLALFALIAITAPILAVNFYGHAIVGWMLIAYGGKLILQNGYFIPWAMMKRELRFKELSALRISANVVEFIAKIGFAATGFGIWCFVLAPLLRTVTYLIGTQLRHRYRPRWEFSYPEAKEYVTFGLRSSGSQILFFFYSNVDYPIVGYFFGDVALGFYRLAYEIVLEPVRVISNVVVDVAFPAFAKLRANTAALVDQFVSFTRLNLITVMSYSAIVFVAAPDVLALLFPSYKGSTEAVQILCAVAVLRAVGFVAPPLLDGVGHPERTLRYMTAAAVAMPLAFTLGAILLGPRLGFESVAAAWALGYPIAFAVLIYMTVVTLNWSVAKYVRAVGGVALCMLAAGGVAAVVYPLLPAGHGVRALVTTVVVVVVSALLLAYTQGLTLRGVVRSMREPPP